MSVTYVRTCDNCGVQQEAQVSWMVMTFPLYAPSDASMPAEAPEFDFCTYACLNAWVTEEDPADEPEAAAQSGLSSVPAVVTKRGAEELAAAQARLDAAMAEQAAKPSMSLMEALASGQLNFDRGPE